MKTNRLTPLLFTTLWLAASSLHAQTDPTAMPAGAPPTSSSPSTHASTPGTVSPGSLAAQDSSTNGGAIDANRMKDKMFLRKVSEGGMAQVQLGQLASQKASSPDVRKLGQKMVDDHTSLNSQFSPLAEEIGLKPAAHLGKTDQTEYDKLNSLSGADFDKEYLTYLTQDHRKDLRDFQREGASTTDPALKDAVAQGEKMIAGHLRMIEKLDEANAISVAPMSR